jgi:hypothetical protein
MDYSTLEQIETELRHLALDEQLWIMERLAKSIRAQTARQPLITDAQLADMAADPDIQRELRQIEVEFSGTEADGLDRTL